MIAEEKRKKFPLENLVAYSSIQCCFALILTSEYQQLISYEETATNLKDMKIFDVMGQLETLIDKISNMFFFGDTCAFSLPFTVRFKTRHREFSIPEEEVEKEEEWTRTNNE